jgi:hypothetical protein
MRSVWLHGRLVPAAAFRMPAVRLAFIFAAVLGRLEEGVLGFEREAMALV